MADAEIAQSGRACASCRETKPCQDFYLNSRTAKYRSRCRACHASAQRADYRARPERHAERKRREASVAKRAQGQRYYAKVRARMAADPSFAEARLATKRERERAYRAADPERFRERDRRAAEALSAARRLHKSFGKLVYQSLRRAKGGKSWPSLVGYSLDDLRTHLERQFTRGMSWDNYGDWHVDHIVPSSSFSYASPVDPAFRACWTLTNLRPLWAKANISKGAARTHLL